MEAAAALRNAGDLSGLWGFHQFGLAHPDVRLRLEALPGAALTIVMCVMCGM